MGPICYLFSYLWGLFVIYFPIYLPIYETYLLSIFLPIYLYMKPICYLFSYLSTYIWNLFVTYFSNYLPICGTYFLQNWLPRWNHTLTQLRFIHNWVISGIQWMVRAGSLLPTWSWLGDWLDYQTCFSCRPVPLQLFKTKLRKHKLISPYLGMYPTFVDPLLYSHSR
jgi:hypothetical protein